MGNEKATEVTSIMSELVSELNQPSCSETLWQNRMAETLRALKAVESQISANGMVMRINTDNLYRLIGDLELAHAAMIRDIDEAWGEMLKFGNHEGMCGFDGECEKCGAKQGRCAKHGEHMALRLNGMTAALNRARQSPNVERSDAPES